MLKSERQSEILQEVVRRGTISVAELAARLKVSEITIRRDLDELGKLGYLQRIRGGARRQIPRVPEPPVVQRQLAQAREKWAIGLAAVELIHDGDVIALDASSTVLELARMITMRSWHNLQVVTNSLIIAHELTGIPGVRLVLIGGSINYEEMAVFGTMAEEMLRWINVDKLFLGCRGIDPRVGLSNDLQAEVLIGTERALVAASRQVIVLADHTKFGQVFLLQSVPVAELDLIITDSLTPEELLQEFRRQDIQVIVAPVEDGANALTDQPSEALKG
ncbi:MAG: DeoR/GlpR family DNA-binding transcription regulator [Anaerolineae bacterium]|nr:DeoR/GlpR family DNA-binding transcription regulator [Anaerolineae bacterium]MDW8100570.1 DeoR/GlpR family DNA-binding transcription regulator [Anaerolineae bacterium]